MDDEKKLEVMNRITRILRDIGVPISAPGFQYLRYGILLAYDDYKSAQRMTKYLYPEIAKEFGATGTRVERSIRRAIEMTFDAGNDNAYKHFKGSVPAKTGKITNAQFIMTLADRLLLEDGISPMV